MAGYASVTAHGLGDAAVDFDPHDLPESGCVAGSRTVGHGFGWYVGAHEHWFPFHVAVGLSVLPDHHYSILRLVFPVQDFDHDTGSYIALHELCSMGC